MYYLKANTKIFLGQAYGQKLLCSKLPLSQIVFASYANFDMPKFAFQNLDYLKRITCDSEQRAKICKTRYPESLSRLLADKSRVICNTR